MVLYGSTSTLAAEQHLNKIYMTVLKYTIRDEYLEEEKQNMCPFLRKVLGTIVPLYSPLPVNSLSELLYLSKGDIERRLAELHAILDAPKDTYRPLRPHHHFATSFSAKIGPAIQSCGWMRSKGIGRWPIPVYNSCRPLLSKISVARALQVCS